MFVARMAQLGRSCRGGIPLNHGDRHARKTLEPLTIGERDGNMPQDRLTPAARRGPSAPSARNRSRPVSHTGLIALIALIAHLKLALLRLFTIPPVSHRDLVLLVRLVRTFSTNAARSEGASGSLFDDCFRPLLGLTPRGCQVKTSANSAACWKVNNSVD
jgi:hypothetical protein